jgi:hypothetical protein
MHHLHDHCLELLVPASLARNHRSDLQRRLGGALS